MRQKNHKTPSRLYVKVINSTKKICTYVVFHFCIFMKWNVLLRSNGVPKPFDINYKMYDRLVNHLGKICESLFEKSVQSRTV